MSNKTPSIELMEVIPFLSHECDCEVVLCTSHFYITYPRTKKHIAANVKVVYRPDQIVVTSDSLMKYLTEYSKEEKFPEEVINQIVEDIVTVCQPFLVRVESSFFMTGGYELFIESNYDIADEDPDSDEEAEEWKKN